MESTKLIFCDNCGKKLVNSEVKYLLINTGCCTNRVPLCSDCWKKVHKP